MKSHLALLHTTPVLIDAFDRLIEEADLEFPVKHIVEEEFLTEAREKGISQDLDGRIKGRIRSVVEDGAAVVLCTCSTIGASAERANDTTDGVVIRVDRPMAERAVEIGSRIVIAAALESTLAPTRNLILEVASTRKKRIDLIEVLCDNAWSRLEDGDNEGYFDEIARTLNERASEGEVIVLAQASMAGAADLCPEISIPILSSPEIGFRHAVDIWKEKVGD